MKLNPFSSSESKEGENNMSGRNWRGRPSTIEIDEELAASVEGRSEDYGPVIFLVPFKREGGIQASRQFFRSVHQPRRAGKGGRENVTPPFTLELVYWKGERRLAYRYAGPDERTRSEIRDELLSTYHDSNIEMGTDEFLGVEPGLHASVAYLRLREEEYLKPINTYKSSPEDFKTDPYDGITSKMTGDGWGADANVMVQLVMKPAISHAEEDALNWHYGSNRLAKTIDTEDKGIRPGAFLEALLSTFVEDMDDDEIEVHEEKFRTGNMSDAASRIADQENNLGYHLNIRIIAVGESAEVAEQRVEATAGKYRNFYNADYGQGFEPVYLKGDDIRAMLNTAASREWVDRDMTMGIEPMMGVGHPPTYINTQGVEYTFTKGDEGPPATATMFEDVDEVGYYDPDTPLKEMPSGDAPPKERDRERNQQHEQRQQQDSLGDTLRNMYEDDE